MINLIQSLPSPSAYSGGITHTWMGETWLVDGEASVVMEVKIPSNSPSRRSARTEFLVPRRSFAMAAAYWMVSGNMVEPPGVFRSRDICSPEESVGGPPRCPDHRA